MRSALFASMLAICAAFASSIAAAETGDGISIPDGARIKVVYDGGMQGTVTVQDRNNRSQVRIGGVNMNFGGTRDVPIQSGYHAEVTYDGANVVGSDRQTGGINGTSTFRGTRAGDTCDIVDNEGHQLRARCTLQVFEFEQVSTDASQQVFKGHFAARQTSVVDIAEQERLQASARAAAERQQAVAQAETARRQAAFQAMLQSRPKATAAQTTAVGNAVAQDSQTWFMNRFDTGSLSDSIIMPPAGDGSTVVRANYTYNGGSRGWVQARLRAGVVQCLEYWDYPGTCSTVRTAQASAGSSGPSDSMREIQRRQEQERIMNDIRTRAAIENTRRQASCPGC